MLPQTFQSATALIEAAGPWLLRLAAAASLALLLSSLLELKRRGKAVRDPAFRPPAERLLFSVALGSLVACFALLAWYHWRIWTDLPLTVVPEVGEWINNNLRALERQGRGGLPPVDWSNPPRYAIPLWIEGEKFFFWSLVYGAALL